MAKRSKRALKSVESIKNEIEIHFKKLENDIKENNLERGRYHFKEINFGFLPALEMKLRLLKKGSKEIELYRKRLDELSKRVEV